MTCAGKGVRVLHRLRASLGASAAAGRSAVDAAVVDAVAEQAAPGGLPVAPVLREHQVDVELTLPIDLDLDFVVASPDGRAAADDVPDARSARTGSSHVTGACVRLMRYEPCTCH